MAFLQSEKGVNHYIIHSKIFKMYIHQQYFKLNVQNDISWKTLSKENTEIVCFVVNLPFPWPIIVWKERFVRYFYKIEQK